MRLSTSQIRALKIACDNQNLLPTKKPEPMEHSKKTSENGVERPLFEAMCRSHGLPVPTPEYPWNEMEEEPFVNPKTNKPYKWRFDWLFSDWLAVEKVGGVWVQGHHSRGQDQLDDMHRRNCAQTRGYVVLEFSPQQINSGEAFVFIKMALGLEASQL